MEVAAVRLEALHPADVHVPEVHGWVPLDDPVGENLPCATGRLDSDGVEPGCNEVVCKVGCLAEQVAVVGGEGLGAVEEEPDTYFAEDGHPLTCTFVDGCQVVPVLAQLHERPVCRWAARSEGLGYRFKGPDQEASGVLLDVDAVVCVSECGEA